MRVKVDNSALPRYARKGRGSTETESDMIREILLLQVRHSWSWELQWAPRECNEAADALSKQDMERFHRNESTPHTQVSVGPGDLMLPSGRHHMTPAEVSRAVCGSGMDDAPPLPQRWDQEHRPHRKALPNPRAYECQGSGQEWHELPLRWDPLAAQLETDGLPR